MTAVWTHKLCTTVSADVGKRHSLRAQPTPVSGEISRSPDADLTIFILLL
jgi:hypothetical protein